MNVDTHLLNPETMMTYAKFIKGATHTVLIKRHHPFIARPATLVMLSLFMMILTLQHISEDATLRTM